jgi:hypothetical protein
MLDHHQRSDCEHQDGMVAHEERSFVGSHCVHQKFCEPIMLHRSGIEVCYQGVKEDLQLSSAFLSEHRVEIQKVVEEGGIIQNAILDTRPQSMLLGEIEIYCHQAVEDFQETLDEVGFWLELRFRELLCVLQEMVTSLYQEGQKVIPNGITHSIGQELQV